MILANEQVHHLAGIDLGDSITLSGESGETDFRVAGFFHDYGNSYYQFYLPYETVEELWPSAGSRGLALWLSTTGMGDIDDIRNTIEQTLVDAGAEPGEWVYRDDILDLSLDIFDRTFAITASMNMLTLTVAGIALLASLLAIHQQRLPQYAHWRSMGVRWTEWLMVILIPLGLCVLITWALSIPLGTLLAWILIHDLNVLAFGWTMPLVWSFSPGLQLALLTAAVVAITFTITLLRVRYHMPDALKQLGEDR
jgi:putative ABC transport system permease protein